MVIFMTIVDSLEICCYSLYIVFRVLSFLLMMFLVFRYADPYRKPGRKTIYRFFNPVNWASFFWPLLILSLNLFLIDIAADLIQKRLETGNAELLFNDMILPVNIVLSVFCVIFANVMIFLIYETMVKIAEIVLLVPFVLMRHAAVLVESWFKKGA